MKKVYEINVVTGEIIREYNSTKEADRIIGITHTKSRIRNGVIKDNITWSYSPKL
jgi:hypothetical protein